MDKQFLTIFALSIISGFILRRRFPVDVAPKVVNRMAWLFLVVLAAETFSVHAPAPFYLVSGMVFLLFVTGLAFLLRGFGGTDSADYLAIASTTFGGGNRGYALVTTISTWPLFSLQQRNDIVAAFLQLDVMVLAWLMLVVPTLLWHKNKDAKVDFVDSIKSVAKDLGAAPIVVMGIILLSWAFPSDLKAAFAAFLQPSHSVRSALLLYLSLTYIFMMTTLATSRLGEVIKGLVIFYLPRWAAAILLIVVAMQFTGRTFAAMVLELPFVLPMIVFAFCPPSNGFNNFLESFKAPRERISEISNLNIITTLLFVLILMLATLIGPYVAAWLVPGS